MLSIYHRDNRTLLNSLKGVNEFRTIKNLFYLYSVENCLPNIH